ncbi:MAG: hypothetical protein BWY71_00513 [Planctomycetes bacterium ADurb.Bin412]|nr:MAG: hypothetical protein BWY71_00513 [Planctomycetes bacterium ADurb.Bin412]
MKTIGSFVIIVILTLAVTAYFLGCNESQNLNSAKDNPPMHKSLPDIIGSTHVKGMYYLTDKDNLNEGADQLLGMGSRVIKIWFYGKRPEHPEHVYSYNSNWPTVSSLVEGAKLPYFQDFFNKPFTTYIFCVTSLGRRDDYWVNGITLADLQDETRQFYELAKYLLTAYQNTGKTFVLQHWEGDWMARMANPNPFDENTDPAPQVFQNMIAWLNARQAGVNQARLEVGQKGVRVYHAVEVNRVVKTMKEGKPNLIDQVVPYTFVDLVSYSSYDSIFAALDGHPELFAQSIDFIKDHLPSSVVWGRNSVYIGEFGIPENEFSPQQIETIVTNVVETALAKNCPYIMYWQLYCNEPKPGVTIPTWNKDDLRGFWLIRPDGSKTWAYNYFANLCRSGGSN